MPSTFGASQFYSAEPAQIRSAGRTLTQGAESIAAARRYEPLGGLIEAHTIEDAAERFRAMWDMALNRWQASLATLAMATTESAEAITATDKNAATTFTAMATDMGNR